MNIEFSVEYCFKGIIEFKEKYGDLFTVKKFDDKIKTLRNPKLSYLFFKNIEGCNKKAHTRIIIDSKNPKFIYETAKIKGINTHELEKAIVEIKDPFWSYIYARDIKDANIKEHEMIVLNSSDNLVKYHFAKDVIGSDKRKIGMNVIEMGDANINFFFARDIKDGLFKEHIEVVKKDIELYKRLQAMFNLSDLKNIKGEMAKDARRVLRKLDYIATE